MSLKIKYLKTILTGLRYCDLPKLINRQIEICSIETVESDIFAILGGDLPNESHLLSPEKIYIEGAIAKYGIIDVKFAVSNKHLANCSIIKGDTLRKLGLVLTKEDKENISQNTNKNDDEDLGLIDFLAEDVEKNEALIKLFLRVENQSPKLALKLPNDYFPQTFVVEDACLTNSGYVWFNKHFYF